MQQLHEEYLGVGVNLGTGKALAAAFLNVTFSFVFLAVGRPKNKAGNALFCISFLLLLFPFLLSDAVPSPSVTLPVAVLPCHRHVNAASTVCHPRV